MTKFVTKHFSRLVYLDRNNHFSINKNNITSNLVSYRHWGHECRVNIELFSKQDNFKLITQSVNPQITITLIQCFDIFHRKGALYLLKCTSSDEKKTIRKSPYPVNTHKLLLKKEYLKSLERCETYDNVDMCAHQIRDIYDVNTQITNNQLKW